jgi:hypothetical protein
MPSPLAVTQQHALSVVHSRYTERLQGSLQRKAGQESRMLAAAAETQARKQEGRATLVGLQPKVSCESIIYFSEAASLR